MTRKRSSPMGLEILLSVLLAFIMLPLITQAAPLQEYTEIQQYTEGCYYNYNHYNEGDRIMTNEPCLNCTCHNKMLMCYLRVCPFTKPIGHDCIVEKREDQCCPIITCPEVPVDVAHAAPEPGTELSFPEKFGCNIDGQFYLEGAQVPSNANKPCELCYCIKNHTSCLMQECTLHIDGCTPIYNKGSCCPVRYNCDHENDVLELEDHSTSTEAATTTTTERPTTGFIISSTMTPAISTDCIHNKEVYADGARIPGETACENCYCMRGDIVCAVQDCHMPIINDNGKLCQPLPAAEGECCPSNYVCEDDTTTTEIIEATTLPYEEAKVSAISPVKDLHSGIPDEDLQLQTHIDEEEGATKTPLATEEEKEAGIPTVRKPVATENQEDTESTIKYNEAEATTISSSDVKSDESNEFVTATPALSDKQSDSTTEGIFVTQAEVQEEETTAKSEHVVQEDQKEPSKEVPTETSKLPEISTDIAAISEAHSTTVSVSDIDHSVTELIPTEEKEPEKATESVEEIKSIDNETSVTQIPHITDKIDASEVNESESKPVESEDSTTGETGEVEKKPVEYSTKSSLDIGTTTETAEEEETGELATGTPIKSILDEQTTKISTEVEEETSIKSKPEDTESSITEEHIDATTSVPEKVASEGTDMSTEEPKEPSQEPEDKEKQHEEVITSLPPLPHDQEESTEFSERKEPVFTTEISVKGEIVTKLPVSPEEKPIATSTSKIEGEFAATLPTIVDSEPSKEDKKVLEEEKPDITTEYPIKSEDDQISTTEAKPIFDGELGSGYDTIEVSTEKSSTSSPSKKPITSLPEEQDKGEEDYTTAKPGDSTEDKPSEENTSIEASGESAESSESTESAESEEDNKLLDLTTAKSTEIDTTASAYDNTKDDDKQTKITTTKPPIAIQEITEKHETVTDKQPSDDTTSEFTTISPLLEEKLSTTGEEYIEKLKDKLSEDTTTTAAVEDAEQEQESEKTESSEELENLTNKTTIEEHYQETSTAQTYVTVSDGLEEEHKLASESGDHKTKEETETTDSTVVTEEERFTTAYPISQTDISKEDSTKVEQPTIDVKSDFEVQTSTTKPARAEEIPIVHLPSSIPGEGDCLVGHKTFENNTIVPSSNECEVLCKCVSSIVVCEHVKCDVPENVEKCTLDESSTNQCCPTYICSDSAEPIKEEVDDEVQHPTSSSTATEEEESLTTKPTLNAVIPGMSIPEIEMPVAYTEEPMSHVKDEDELETQTAKPTVPSIAEDKHDIVAEGHSSTTPPDVKDFIAPESIASVEIIEKEKHEHERPEIFTDEQTPHTTSEVKPEIEHIVSQEQPKEEVNEHTTFAHEFIESTTASTGHLPSAKKDESETQFTSKVPVTDDYPTVKPFDEEGSGDEETDVEIQTALPTTLPVDEIKIVKEHEDVKDTEVQTDKEVTSESTEEPSSTDIAEPHVVIEPETQTAYPNETEKEIQITPTTPVNEILAETEGQQSSTEVVSKDIISSTAAAPIEEHDTHAVEEDIFTTVFPSVDDSKSETTTSKQASDTDSAFEQSTSTIATLSEKDGEIDHISSEAIPAIEVELSTVVSDYDKTDAPVETKKDEILEHGISHDEQTETVEGPSSTTYQPETQTNIAYTDYHTIAPTAEEDDDKNEEKETSTSVPDEKISAFSTTSIPQDTEISTEKSHDLETKIDTSSLTPSTDDDVTHEPTTVSSVFEKTFESKKPEEENTSELFTEGSGEQQTETEEIAETTVPSTKYTEQTKGETVTTSSVELGKDDDHTEEIESQKADQSTVNPLISHEPATEATLSNEDDLISVKKEQIVPESESNKPLEQTTTEGSDEVLSAHVPTQHPNIDLFEEGSGESEEEVITELGVTQQAEEQDSEEATKGIDKFKDTTEGQENEIYITTEQTRIPAEQELNVVSTDKTTLDDKKPITVSSISSETISEESTDKVDISSVTKPPLDELHTDLQTEKELSGEHESTETPKDTGILTGVQKETESEVGSGEADEDQTASSVTQAPTDFEDKDDTTIAPISAEEIEAVKATHPQEESTPDVTKTEDVEHYTEQSEDNIESSTIKASLPIDESQQITDRYPTEDVNIVTSTRSPVASEDLESSTAQDFDEKKLEDSTIFESSTDKLPSDEIVEETTAHIVPLEVEQNKEEVSEKDDENVTVKAAEENDFVSDTSTTTESTYIQIIKSSTEGEYNLDITTGPLYLDKETPNKLPEHDEEVIIANVTQLPANEIEYGQENGENVAKVTEVTLTPQGEIHDSATEISSTDSQPEKESNLSSTVLPESPEVPTEKLPESTAQPVKETEIEETTYYAPEVVTDSTDKLSAHNTEKSHEESTEIITDIHISTDLTENTTLLPFGDVVTEGEVSHERATEIPTSSQETSDKLLEQHTELPLEDIEHESESVKPTTELPASVSEESTVASQEQDIDLTTQETHTEDEKSYEQTTRLPTDSHVSTEFENAAQDVTVSPVKETAIEEESTALSGDEETTENKLQEHITEGPTQSLEENVKETHEHEISLPEDVDKSTEVLYDHSTERPTKDIQTEEADHEPTDKLSEHSTEASSADVESEEDVYEKPTESPTKDDESHEESYEKTTELPVVSKDISPSAQEVERTTENATKEGESYSETSTEAAESIGGVEIHTPTTIHPLFAQRSTLPPAAVGSRIDDDKSHSTSSPTKNDVFTTSTATVISSTTTEPITTSAPHYQPQHPIYGQPPQYGPTQYEDEYTDEDEGEVFGPGTCRYGGKLYVSAQQIPRDDPCDFCFCFRSDIICLQQSCPPPIAGCHEEPISGFCCPRYECPVSMATVLNITTSTTTTSTTLPPHFLHHSYGSNVQRNGCFINGRSYRVGEKIESTSGPCINCTCGGDGKMKCDPQACVPEPTMQQVMAVVAAGRKR